jgi:hypothetical protein
MQALARRCSIPRRAEHRIENDVRDVDWFSRNTLIPRFYSARIEI